MEIRDPLSAKALELRLQSEALLQFADAYPDDVWAAGLETICYELEGYSRSDICRRVERFGIHSGRASLDGVSRVDALMSRARNRIDSATNEMEGAERATTVDATSSVIALGASIIGLLSSVV